MPKAFDTTPFQEEVLPRLTPIIKLVYGNKATVSVAGHGPPSYTLIVPGEGTRYFEGKGKTLKAKMAHSQELLIAHLRAAGLAKVEEAQGGVNTWADALATLQGNDPLPSADAQAEPEAEPKIVKPFKVTHHGQRVVCAQTGSGRGSWNGRRGEVVGTERETGAVLVKFDDMLIRNPHPRAVSPFNLQTEPEDEGPEAPPQPEKPHVFKVGDRFQIKRVYGYVFRDEEERNAAHWGETGVVTAVPGKDRNRPRNVPCQLRITLDKDAWHARDGYGSPPTYDILDTALLHLPKLIDGTRVRHARRDGLISEWDGREGTVVGVQRNQDRTQGPMTFHVRFDGADPNLPPAMVEHGHLTVIKAPPGSQVNAPEPDQDFAERQVETHLQAAGLLAALLDALPTVDLEEVCQDLGMPLPRKNLSQAGHTFAAMQKACDQGLLPALITAAFDLSGHEGLEAYMPDT